MDITINIDSPEPLFAQLIEQIKAAVLSDQIKPGDALPSIRQLANNLDINNKTVAKAYQLLERDNVIEAKGYRGSYVHPNAKENSTVDLNAWVLTKFSETIELCKNAGVTDSEIRNAFSSLMNNQR